MTTLYFVRHGQTIWNQAHRMQGFKNSPLTSIGLAQADQLGQYLATDSTITRLLVSPSPRAQQTAAHLNASLHKPILTVPEFQELNMGSWEGQTHTRFMALIVCNNVILNKHRLSLPIALLYACYWLNSYNDQSTQSLIHSQPV